MLSVEKQLADLTLGGLKVAFTWTNGIRILSILGLPLSTAFYSK